MSKRFYITSDQKEALVEFMENHFDLRKGKFSINFTTAIAKTQRENCCKLLNSIPGPAKKWQKWRKNRTRSCTNGIQEYGFVKVVEKVRIFVYEYRSTTFKNRPPVVL
ncbi:hypothetical protein QTP88_016851 [Uroleucon formosanum]